MFLFDLRSHLDRRSFLKGILLSTGAAASCGEPAGESPTRSPQPIPARPGANGYEELMAAAEALKAGKSFEAVERGDGTLAAKRQALQDPPVIRALALLRRGLGKPVFSPREEFSVESSLSEMSGFRRLGRLLALEQYVMLADGRVPEAIGCVRLGLRLGRAAQTGPVVTGLVGLAISALSIRPVGGHLDQLSARDCELLYQVCQEWLRLPDLSPQALEAERQFARRALAENWKKERVEELVGLSGQEAQPPDEESRRARQLLPELKRLKASSPEGYRDLRTQVEERFDQIYVRVQAEWKKPAWERSGVEAPEDASLAGRLVAAMSPVAIIGPACNSYTREQAQVRLLACHAVIGRYRWEHDRLPASLAGLTLSDLAIDPFTGRPLKYTVRGKGYELTSAGPPAAADDTRAVDGRRPVSVVPAE